MVKRFKLVIDNFYLHVTSRNTLLAWSYKKIQYNQYCRSFYRNICWMSCRCTCGGSKYHSYIFQKNQTEKRISLHGKSRRSRKVHRLFNTILCILICWIGKTDETSKSHRPYLWSRSKCWMRAHKRTFNAQRLKSQIWTMGFRCFWQFCQFNKSEYKKLY